MHFPLAHALISAAFEIMYKTAQLVFSAQNPVIAMGPPLELTSRIIHSIHCGLIAPDKDPNSQSSTSLKAIVDALVSNLLVPYLDLLESARLRCVSPDANGRRGVIHVITQCNKVYLCGSVLLKVD